MRFTLSGHEMNILEWIFIMAARFVQSLVRSLVDLLPSRYRRSDRRSGRIEVSH